LDTSRRKKGDVAQARTARFYKLWYGGRDQRRFDAAALSLNYERTPYYPSAEPDIQQQRLS